MSSQSQIENASEAAAGAELGGLFDQPPEAHADADSLERTLQALLAVHPQAPVGAMNSAGIYVPMPDSIALGERPVMEGRSGLDLIGEDDMAAVLENWIARSRSEHHGARSTRPGATM